MICVRRREGAFTLVEVMVLSVVSLMLVTLVAQVFLIATRRTEDARLRVDLQQTGVFILQRFERDIALTSAHAMQVADDGEFYVLSMTSAAGWNATQGVTWQEKQQIWVFDRAKRSIHKEEYPPKAPAWSDEPTWSRPYLPSPSELAATARTASGQERILSSDIEEFSLSDRTGSKTRFQTQPLKLEMKLRRPLSTSGRFAEFTVTRRFALRNDF